MRINHGLHKNDLSKTKKYCQGGKIEATKIMCV